jgi:hypothetical protein
VAHACCYCDGDCDCGAVDAASCSGCDDCSAGNDRDDDAPDDDDQMIEPPRPFGPHPMLPNPNGLEPRFALQAVHAMQAVHNRLESQLLDAVVLAARDETEAVGVVISIVQRKRAAERGLLLEGDVALRCACGNVDSAPSFWFASRVQPRIQCSAECGRFMERAGVPA